MKIILLSLGGAAVAFVLFELLWLRFVGAPVAIPSIVRDSQTMGQGPALRYVIMGDSTTIAQGGDYNVAYAVKSAEYLAATHKLTWMNVGISGAHAQDVVDAQLAQAIAFAPDVALVVVGANDVTRLTSPSSMEASLRTIIYGLRRANPRVRIVVTGSPDMGAIPRLPQPLRWLAGKRTEAINRMVSRLVGEEKLTLAAVAEQTGPTFRAHPELFAADKFHPNDQGYAVWNPVIVDAVKRTMFE